jgi:LPS export ABC transporter protein LptC
VDLFAVDLVQLSIGCVISYLFLGVFNLAQHRQQPPRWLDKWGRSQIFPWKWSISIVAMLLLGGCAGSSKSPPSSKSAPIEAKLELDNLSFQQVDKQGKPLWKVRAKKGIYAPDKKRAKIAGIDGDFYQDGQIVLHVTANTGEVEQEGEKVILRGDVIAKETRNNLVIIGQEVEWQPKTDLLTIRDRVRVNHPQLQVQADRGEYHSREQRMDLTSKIAAISTEPRLGMQTEHLLWLLKTQTVTSDRSVEIQRYEGKVITARVRANSSTTSLDRKILDLKGNVQFTGVKPPIQVAGESFSWNLDREIVTADRPLTIVDPGQGVTLQSNTGQLNLKANTATLAGNARGVATGNQAKLYADRLTWQMISQQLIGTGNIIYQQSQPSIKFTGSRSIGKLQDQSIVVTSDRQRQVQTEIIPK